MAECSVYRDGAKLRARQRLLPVAERQRRFDRTAGRNLDAEGQSLDSELATSGANRLPAGGDDTEVSENRLPLTPLFAF